MSRAFVVKTVLPSHAMTNRFDTTGNGSIYRTTTSSGIGVYQAKIILKDNQTGTKYSITGTGSTKKQAIERRTKNLQRKILKLDRNADTKPATQTKTRIRAKKKGLTLQEFLPIAEKIQGNRTKQQTKNLQRRRLENHVFPWITQPMEKLTSTQLETHFYTTLPNNGYTEFSINVAFKATKMLLNRAVRAGYIKSNPMANITIKNPVSKISQEDQQYHNKRVAIFKHLLKELSDPNHPNHEHYPMILMMGLGMRRAEILGLAWGDILNLTKKGRAIAYLHQQLIYIPHEGYHLQQALKNEKDRRLTLPEPHRKALLNLKKQWDPEQRDDLARNLVFTHNNKAISYANYNRIWRKVLTDYMTKDGRQLRKTDLWRPHYNRKIAATLLVENGVPVKVAAEYLGHNPVIMLQIYEQVSREQLTTASDTLADALGLTD